MVRSLLLRYFAGTCEGPFADYVRRFTDGPLLVALRPLGEEWVASGLYEAAVPGDHPRSAVPGAGFLVWDETTDQPTALQGPASPGNTNAAGRGNLRLENARTGAPVLPRLSMYDQDRTVPVRLVDCLSGEAAVRSVPARRLASTGGDPVMVTTVMDLFLAHYGVPRTLSDPEVRPCDESVFDAPGWAEEHCGVSAETIDRFAGEWGETARRTGGRCLVLVGPDGLRNSPSAGVLSGIAHTLILTGCMGRRGGGLGYYSGQRKIIPADSWSLVGRARDWVRAARTTIESAPRILLTWGLDPAVSDRIWQGPLRADPEPGGTVDASASNAGAGEGSECAPDLVVDLSFRIDPTALTADVILPAATWYERCDLNSAERPGSIQAVVPVVAPRGESLSEWQIFRRLARRFSDLAAIHCPDAILDPVRCQDGGTERQTITIERRYAELARHFDTLGPERPNPGFAAPVDSPPATFPPPGEARRASPASDPESTLTDPVELILDSVVCDTILQLSSATNGEAAFRLFRRLEQETGVPLQGLAEPQRPTRINWLELMAAPRRPLVTPLWSGISGSRPYVPFALNVEYDIPWRTLTGRQQLFVGLPSGPETSTPAGRLDSSGSSSGAEPAVRLRWRSIRDKWTFGSLFADRRNVGALFRGPAPVWISPEDAQRMGVDDNDWIELHFEERVHVARCAVSRAVPRGVALGSPETYPFRTPGPPPEPWLFDGDLGPGVRSGTVGAPALGSCDRLPTHWRSPLPGSCAVIARRHSRKEESLP